MKYHMPTTLKQCPLPTTLETAFHTYKIIKADAACLLHKTGTYNIQEQTQGQRLDSYGSYGLTTYEKAVLNVRKSGQ